MAKYRTSEKTKLGLIDAGGELAAEIGFQAITTRSIAQRAGENIGSIHYHFGSKENLFEAILMTACQRWLENPLEEAFRDCNLKNKEGQAEAIRKGIVRVADLIFDKNVPAWYCRVIFQAMQTSRPLRELFLTRVMDKKREQIEKVLLAIDPSLSENMILQHFLLLYSPLIFHADYQEAILLRLNQSEYSSDYLQQLVENCVQQALLRYGLPLK
jgi:TetR/AcrR family transcriptional regulator, regulator of cefoperazone and chloramphenicol sensitivity